MEIHHGDADDLSGGLDADDCEDDHGHHHLHEDVRVTGRMAPISTPWDRAVIVPVEYVWMAHALRTGHAIEDPAIGGPWLPGLLPPLPAIVVKPDSIAAAYGLRARNRSDQTMAFFPAETLIELSTIAAGTTRIMTALTLAAQGLAVLDLQRRGFAVLRAMGAPAGFVFLVVWLYVGTLLFVGAILGPPFGWLLAKALSAMIATKTDIALSPLIAWPEIAMACVFFAVSVLPAWRLYRQRVVEALRQG